MNTLYRTNPEWRAKKISSLSRQFPQCKYNKLQEKFTLFLHIVRNWDCYHAEKSLNSLLATPTFLFFTTTSVPVLSTVADLA